MTIYALRTVDDKLLGIYTTVELAKQFTVKLTGRTNIEWVEVFAGMSYVGTVNGESLYAIDKAPIDC